MRYFLFTDGSSKVTSTLTSDRVPGDGGEDGLTLPANCIEVDLATVSAAEATPGGTFVDGAIVPPAALLPTFSKVQFLNLFTPVQRAAIRQFRRENVDDQVEDFYEMLQMATDPIDPNQSTAAALLSAGLGLLVSKGLLTAPEAARIASGTPPA